MTLRASDFRPRLPLEPARRTISEIIRSQADAYGDATLSREGDRTHTFRETAVRAESVASRLRAVGVDPGDRVVVMSENRLEVLDVFTGCAWAGAVFTPLNTASQGPQLRHVLEEADPRVVVTQSELIPALEGASASMRSLRTVFVFDGDGRSRALGTVTEPFNSTCSEPSVPYHASPDDPVAILYTSGTTGPSKGVVCPHPQFYWWGEYLSWMLGLREDDILYSTLPLFHTNALSTFLQSLVSGATFVIGDRFSASRFWGDLARSGATVTYLLGTMVAMLERRSPSEFDPHHRVRVALAPGTTHEQVEAFRKRFGVQLVDAYGSTETNAVLSSALADECQGRMGHPMPGFEVAVVDEFDAPVPPGTGGELVVRAREAFSTASGYFRNDNATVAAWRNLWFHTGDQVVQEPDGSFRFLARLKDAIRRRGENISAFEVEHVLESAPHVSLVAVVGVASELGEEDVMAFVVPDGDAIVDPAALIEFCKPRLAYFAVPRFVEVVQELPLTENGKVRKAALRERGRGPNTWDREAAGIEVRR